MATNVGELAISLDIELSSNVEKQISKVSEGIASKLKTGIESATGNMSGSLSKGLGKTFSKLSDSTKKVGTNIGKGIADGVSKSTSKLGDLVRANLDKAKAKVSNTTASAFTAAAPSSSGSTQAASAAKVKPGITKDSLITRRDNDMGMQDNLDAQIRKYQASLREMSALNIDGGVTEDMLKIEQRILSLTDKFERLSVDIRQLDAEIDGFDTNKSESEMNQASSAAEKLSNQAKKVTNSVKQTSSSMGGLGKESKKSERPLINMRSIGASLARNFLGLQLMISLVGQAVRKMAQGLWAAFNTNAQFKSSLQQIQSNLATAFQPIFQAVMPAINSMMAGLSRATAYIAAFLSLLSGKSVQASNASAQAMKKQTDSMNGYSAAAAEAASVTAGFDQLNDITSSQSGAGAGSGASAASTPIIPVNIDDDQIGKIDKFMKNIKSIIDKNKTTILASFAGLIAGFGMYLAIINWTATTAGLTAALGGIAQAFMFINSPAIAIAAAIALLIARMVYLWNTSQTFRDGVIALVSDIQATLTPFFDNITKIFTDTVQIISDTWNKYGKTILDGIDAFIIGAVETFNLIWTNIIDPIIRPAIEMLSSLWDDHLKAIVLQIADFVGFAITKALELYNQFIKPVIDWLVIALGPAFTTVFSLIFGTVGGAMGGILTTVSSIISSVRKIFEGLITFLQGVFTGDWKKIWQGLSDVFGGIFDGLKALFKAPINWIIDGLNGFIRSLNKIKIPDWVPGVGGKSFNFGTIPTLASGGVLKQPTLNIAGEYPGASSNPEIVAPQNIMADTFRQVLKEFVDAMKSGNQVSSQSLQLVVNIGGKTVLDTILELAEEYRRQTGKELSINVG